MAFVTKLLGAGVTNAGTVTVLYTVPTSASSAIVRNVRLVTTGTAATVNAFVLPTGGAQAAIAEKDKSLVAQDMLLITPELTLAKGDQIQVTTSAAVHYVVSGMERI